MNGALGWTLICIAVEGRSCDANQRCTRRILWCPTIDFDTCIGDRECVDFRKNDVSVQDEDTYVLSGASTPEAQEKLFKKLLRVTGCPGERFITVDIRDTDNEGMLARLKDKGDRAQEGGRGGCKLLTDGLRQCRLF